MTSFLPSIATRPLSQRSWCRCQASHSEKFAPKLSTYSSAGGTIRPDQHPTPPRCREKSSRSPASPSVSMLATYVSNPTRSLGEKGRRLRGHIEQKELISLRFTESHTAPAEAASLAHERPSEQENCVCERGRERGLGVCKEPWRHGENAARAQD